MSTNREHLLSELIAQSPIKMSKLINSNIIYGGDSVGVSNTSWASLGEMLLTDLTKGDKRDLFVSIFDRITSYRIKNSDNNIC